MKYLLLVGHLFFFNLSGQNRVLYGFLAVFGLKEIISRLVFVRICLLFIPARNPYFLAVKSMSAHSERGCY